MQPLGAAFEHGQLERGGQGFLVRIAIGPIGTRGVERIVASDGLQHESAIVGRAGHRPQLVERPTEGHRPVTTHAAIGGTQAGHAAVGGRRDDRAPGFAPDGERYQPGRDRRAGAAAAAAGPTRAVPRIQAGASERGVGLLIAHASGDLDQRELADEHRPGVAQSLHDRRVLIERLLAQGRRAPGGWKATLTEQVLGPVRNAMQRPAILAGRQLAIGLCRLLQGQCMRHRHDRVELRSQLLQAFKKQTREFDRRHTPRAEFLAQLTH